MGRVELAVVVIILAILASLLVPAIDRANRNSRVSSCCSHLAILWKMEYNYAQRYGRMPDETGEAFWLRLSKPPMVFIDLTLADLYQCPVEGVDDPGVDYRGPACDVERLGDGEPVAADVPGNHGEGGNVLRKSGDVQCVGEWDQLWLRARSTTTGGSPPVPVRTPRTIVWILLVAAALLMIVRFLAPTVAPRSWAFFTALIGLLVLAGVAYLC